MTLFDQLFFNCFNHYKKSTFKKNANPIAVCYVTVVQMSLLLVLGVFFAEFLGKMHVNTMSATDAWVLFIIVSVLLYFINWIQYSGKKRTIMYANQKKISNYGVFTLWLIPLVALFLAIIALKIF